MADEFYRRSTVTGRSYDVFKCVKLLNSKQCAFYLAENVPLRDIKLSTDRKTNEPILVYYFYKEDTKDAFDKWCRQKEVGNDFTG